MTPSRTGALLRFRDHQHRRSPHLQKLILLKSKRETREETTEITDKDSYDLMTGSALDTTVGVEDEKTNGEVTPPVITFAAAGDHAQSLSHFVAQVESYHEKTS